MPGVTIAAVLRAHTVDDRRGSVLDLRVRVVARPLVERVHGSALPETGVSHQRGNGTRHHGAPAFAMIRSRFSGFMNAGSGLDPVIDA